LASLSKLRVVLPPSTAHAGSMNFRIRGVPQQIADEVRLTRRSPGYGHSAQAELAGGTGPCRCCLRPFVPGLDRRLLFTYRPPGREGTLTAPGPVFIHESRCAAWAGEGFPDSLRVLPLAFEARASGSRVVALSADANASAETQMGALFAHSEVQWLHLRHAEAGCFIALVEK
jgi:hypothetical protein